MSTTRRVKEHRQVTLERRSGNEIPGFSCPALETNVAALGLRISGAPWWAICCVYFLMIVLLLAQTVFPQDSRDKVIWWIAHWQSRKSRKRSQSLLSSGRCQRRS